MYKLLTDEMKEKIKGEYSTRRLLAIFIMLILVIVVGLLGLFPSFLLSETKFSELSDTVQVIKDGPSAQDDAALSDWLNNFNIKLQTLAPSASTSDPTDFIIKALGSKSSGIAISILNWSKDNKGIETLSLTGTAATRQALLTLEDNLNKSGNFSNVALPVSSLAQDSNLSFQMKLTLNKK